MEGTLKLGYSVTVWCAVLDDQLIGLFIFEGRPTGGMYVRFLQDRQLPGLLEDVPLNEWRRMYIQHDEAPHFSREIKFWTTVSLGDGLDVAAHRIIVYGDG